MHVAHSENNLHNGEEFVYRSYNCRITYNGIRPHFTIDGENAENVIEGFEVTPETVGSSGWKYSLIRAIDEMEGVDTDSESYIEPRERELIRRKSRDYMYSLAEVYGFKTAHEVIEESDFDGVAGIREEVTSRAKELMQEEEAFGLEAFDRARGEVFEDLMEV